MDLLFAEITPAPLNTAVGMLTVESFVMCTSFSFSFPAAKLC